VIAARGRHNPVTFEEFRVVSSLFLCERTERPASPATTNESTQDLARLVIGVPSRHWLWDAVVVEIRAAERRQGCAAIRHSDTTAGQEEHGDAEA
jgi:hypothetical protein